MISISRGRKFFNIFSVATTLTLFALFFSTYITQAAPPNSPYYPGETTDPGCAPGALNCSVVAPLSTTLTATTTITMDNHALDFDSGTLYVDSINNRVGIGTASPSGRLTVYDGDMYIGDGSSTSTFSKNNLILGQTAANALGKFYIDSSGNVSTSSSIFTFGNVTSTGIIYANSGLISSASSSFGGQMNVSANIIPNSNNSVSLGSFGNAFSNLYTSGTAYLSNLSLTNVSSTGITADSYVNTAILTVNNDASLYGNLFVGIASGFDSGKFKVNSAGLISASSSIFTYGNVTSTGIIYANSGIISSASSSFGGQLNVSAVSSTGITASSYVSSTNLYTSGASYFADGTQALPSLTFNSDPNTGIYRAGADAISMVYGGNVGLYVNSSGVQIGAGSTILSYSATAGLWLRGQDTNDSSAIGIRLDNKTALNTAGAKIASFENAAGLRSYITWDGGLALGVSTTAGFNSGRFFVDGASGNVSASSSIFTYGNVTSTGHIYGSANNTVDLGTYGYGFKNMYVSSTAYLADLSLNNTISWNKGTAVTAGEYLITRNNDATNLMQFEVPTGSSYEFSVNDTMKSTLSSSSFTHVGTIFTPSVQSYSASASLKLIGRETDASDSINVTLNGTVTLTAAGSRIASFQNNDVQKAYIDKDGDFVTGIQTGYEGGTFFVDANTGNVTATGSLRTYGNVTSTGHIYGSANNTVDLGAYGYGFRNVYASGTIMANILAVDSTTVTSTFGTGGLTIGATQLAVQGATGNIGIGTLPTRGKMEIKQTLDTNAGGFTITNSAVSASARWWLDASAIQHIDNGTGADGGISLNNGKLYIQATTGNVGIGDTTPIAPLTVGSGDKFTVSSAGLVIASSSIFTYGNVTSTGIMYANSGIIASTMAIGTSTFPTTINSYKLYVEASSDTSPGLGVRGYIKATDFISSTSTLDLAENYPIDSGCYTNGVCPEKEDVVCLDTQIGGGVVRKCTPTDEDNIIGVVSTRPGFLLGGYEFYNPGVRPVALAGRVPIHVSTENGSIHIGDYLTISTTTDGYAVKSLESGKVIGMALNELIGDNTTVLGTVDVFIKPQWNIGDGGLADNANELSESVNPVASGLLDKFTLTIKNSLKKLGIIAREGVVKISSLWAKEVHTEKICIGETCITEDIMKQLLNGTGATAAPAAVIVPAVVPIDPVVPTTTPVIQSESEESAPTEEPITPVETVVPPTEEVAVPPVVEEPAPAVPPIETPVAPVPEILPVEVPVTE